MGEAGEGFIAAPGQRLAETHIKAGGEQSFVAAHRPLTELLQRRRADLALRRVDDTQEGAVVVRVGQHAQIGQQIFNFRTRKERRAAGDFVRDAVLHQHLFKDPRLVIAAIKDRVVFVIGFINEVVGDQLPGHALRFMIFIVGGEHFQLRAISQFGEQPLFKDVRVIGDQNVGGFQNTPG